MELSEMKSGNQAFRILCVDDSIDNQQLYINGLSPQYEVLVAEDVDAGMRIAEEGSPDAIVLDVHLPGRSGYEMCEMIRKQPGICELPVLFVSGMVALDDRIQGYQAGGDDYLCKPVDMDELKEKIAINLQRSEQRHGLQDQLQQATSAAFTAMSSAGETGLVLNFIAETFNLKSYVALADGVFGFLSGFGLSACLQLRTYHGPLNYSSNGGIKPLEEELMTLSSKANRIISADNKTIFNEPNVTLLIKNMPINDDELCGRLRDHLALAVRGISSRVNAMRLEEENRVQRERKVGDNFSKLKTHIKGLDQRFRELGAEVGKAMDSLIIDMEHAVIGMGLSEDEEKQLLDIVRAGKTRLEDVQDISDELESRFLQLESAFIEATIDEAITE